MSLEFVNAGMLGALTAGVAPILIHYLTRARPRRIRFPTYQFLVEAGSGRQAMHRLRDFLILLLRVLAIVALVGVFARPFLRAGSAAVKDEEGRRVVVLVDASLSMRAARGGFSLFDRARAEAADVLRGLEPGSQAAVILIGAKPRPALPDLSRNLTNLHDALVKAEPTLEMGDPLAAIAMARTMLGGTGTVYVFSDFQRTNWSAVQFDRIEGVECVLRPVALRATQNLAIVGVEMAPAEPVAGEPVHLTATVFNCTPKQRTEAVRLELGGAAERAALTLRPYSSGRATLTVTLREVGIASGKLSLDGDDLPEDNVRYVRVPVRRALRVVVVTDASGHDVTSPAFFLSKAIAPSRDAARGIEVTARHGQTTNLEAIESADAVVIAPPVNLSRGAATAVARCVTGGGRLLCVLDGPTAPAVLGALASASKGAVAPPFALLRPTAAPKEGEPFARFRETADALQLFADPSEGDLRALRFRRHYLTEIADARAEEVIAFFADGAAALSLGPAGRGRAAFANFPIDPEGGTLVRSPLFPALMHELLRSLRRSGSEESATPGRPWHIDVPAAGGGSGSFEIVGPSGARVPFEAIAQGGALRLALGPAAELGSYSVRRGGALVAVGVVNTDPRESDTREVPLKFLSAAADVAKAGGAAAAAEGARPESERQRPLWQWLAAFAAAALAGEMLVLALWRSHRRGAAAIRAARETA